jgi:hypothetical protein
VSRTCSPRRYFIYFFQYGMEIWWRGLNVHTCVKSVQIERAGLYKARRPPFIIFLPHFHKSQRRPKFILAPPPPPPLPL